MAVINIDHDECEKLWVDRSGFANEVGGPQGFSIYCGVRLEFENETDAVKLARMILDRMGETHPARVDETEKNRRIYYQSIVYRVCNALDRIYGRRTGEGIVCGTLETPSGEVELEMEQLASAALAIRKVLIAKAAT